eukprot:1562230-Prymnesium_polylepis.3
MAKVLCASPASITPPPYITTISYSVAPVAPVASNPLSPTSHCDRQGFPAQSFAPYTGAHVVPRTGEHTRPSRRNTIPRDRAGSHREGGGRRAAAAV